MTRPLTLLLFCLYVTMLPCVTNAQTITVYTSANFAPLVINEPDGAPARQRGLYPELVDYLNRQQLGATRFKLAYLPRKRLQMQLEQGQLDGIVIGMMPQWLDDAEQKKYLWTSVFATDRFVLVSRVTHPMAPGPNKKFNGKTIGLTLGYVYPGIDEWIRQQGLVRNDAPTEQTNLDKLMLGRVDGAAVSESVARYYIREHKLAGQLLLVDLPGRQTERRLLVPQDKKAVYDLLVPVIRKLHTDPDWQNATARYE